MREPARTAHPSERVVGGLAAVAFTGPVVLIPLSTILGVLWDGYDPIRDTQSELGAVDSPFRDAMNFGGFFVLGVSILAFAAVYTLILPRTMLCALVVVLLLVAGFGMGAVAFFPCDAGCVDVTSVGRTHGLLSAPGAIGLPSAAILSALLFRSTALFGVRWQVASFWIGLLSLASGPVIALDLLDGGLGLLQRAAMWPPLLWMSAVSWRIGAASMHGKSIVTPA